jgi:hypothetical protein
MHVPHRSTLRAATAAIVTATGIAQVAMLWVLPLEAATLLTALLGLLYLLLALGLSGISRFAIGLAVGFCALRAVTGFNAIPLELWEQLRTGADLLVAGTGGALLWRMRHVPAP